VTAADTVEGRWTPSEQHYSRQRVAWTPVDSKEAVDWPTTNSPQKHSHQLQSLHAVFIQLLN